MNQKQIKELSDSLPIYTDQDEGGVLLTFSPPQMGYFDNNEALLNTLKSPNIQQVYAPVQKIRESCIKRLPLNKLEPCKSSQGIKKIDIEGYQFLFIDVDVEIAKNEKRNATESEHNNAIQQGEKIIKYLDDLGYPEPAFIDSANGVHILYYIDLPADLTSVKLIKSALHALSEHFNTETLTVDTRVYDLPRKIKLPGSANYKGENHRFATVINYPEEWDVVSQECLETLAQKWTGKKGKSLSGGREEDKSEIDKILEIVDSEGAYYLDEITRVFADISKDTRIVTYPVESKDFQIILRSLLKEMIDVKIVATDFWTRIYGYLELLAHESGETVSIRNRVAYSPEGDAILYDLQTSDYKMVKITAENVSIEDTPPRIFLRADLDQEQVQPDLTVGSDELIPVLRQLFNFPKEEDLELFTLWLVSCFLPDYEHPILWLSGAQGSAKSTACSIIQSLVSPQELVRSTFPKKTDDLAVHISNRYISVFDNIGGISDEQSNILCQCVTNGTYTKRKLYTDTDMTAIPLRSIIVLNSCDTIITKPDLLSRVLHFNLERLDGGKIEPDNIIRAKIREFIPSVLGGIFDCIKKFFTIEKDEEDIEIVIRLAEFQQLATTIGAVLGMSSEYVRTLLLSNKNNMDIQILESNPVSYLLDNFMKRRKEWEGSVQNLYNELDVLAYEMAVDKRNKLYPRSAASLSQKLNGLETMLEKAGITFNIRNVGNHKQITLVNHNIIKNSKFTRQQNE